ncbi:RNA-directed DNA polymerase, eukaryota, reverse transcriptase zinc-binding domain protein [Tanacetum coccineum]|uniref:RNA-directed DNA polymerase, eukaryota, reverse transcriptase zinc-binding domain protein n=1 Tax=Tanacetum coccineum TaxID=301880 RepID=A0ABQ5G6X4_9ASTR
MFVNIVLIPFRFFHHWIDMEGFCKLVEDSWKNSPSIDSNAMKILMGLIRIRCMTRGGGSKDEVKRAVWKVVTDQASSGLMVSSLQLHSSFLVSCGKRNFIDAVDFEKAYDSVRWDFLDEVLSILKVLESIRSHFFNGHDISSKKVSWVNWNKMIASKDKGGLGVSSLYAVDGNLGSNSKGCMKSCWSSIVTEVNALANKGIDLMQFLRIKMGNGDYIRLWEDPWHEGGIIKFRYPRVYALEMCKSITIGGKLAHPNLSDSFRRYPRGGAEFSQFGEFSALMYQVIRAPIADRWMWTRNSSGEFTVASIRQFIDDKICIGGDHKTTRIRFIPNKVNIHAWKVMLNALPTKFNISRRGIQIDSIICVNCGIGVETTNHLFFTCEMAQKVSHLINRWWDVPDSEFDSYASWKVWVTNIRLPGKTKLMFEGIEVKPHLVGMIGLKIQTLLSCNF